VRPPRTRNCNNTNIRYNNTNDILKPPAGYRNNNNANMKIKLWLLAFQISTFFKNSISN
jgi:hypothetical protein